jgi:hypothetical protein
MELFLCKKGWLFHFSKYLISILFSLKNNMSSIKGFFFSNGALHHITLMFNGGVCKICAPSMFPPWTCTYFRNTPLQGHYPTLKPQFTCPLPKAIMNQHPTTHNAKWLVCG